MADDTRQPSTSPPSPPAAPETMEAPAVPLPPRPRGPANIMPGGTAHTAGGQKIDEPELTYFDVVRSLGPEYYLNFHKRPCVRDSQLQGIAAGFVGGGVAGVLGKSVQVSSNWAVITWCGVSMVSYQVCQYYRSRERAGIRQAKALMEEKRALMQAKQEARRKARIEQMKLEEERQAEEARKKTWTYWYHKNIKFW